MSNAIRKHPRMNLGLMALESRWKTARDNGGHVVSHPSGLRGRPGGGQEAGKPVPTPPKTGLLHRDKPVGKLAFSQQLKLAARNAAIRFS
jgi:hypothetical protein